MIRKIKYCIFISLLFILSIPVSLSAEEDEILVLETSMDYMKDGGALYNETFSADDEKANSIFQYKPSDFGKSTEKYIKNKEFCRVIPKPSKDSKFTLVSFEIEFKSIRKEDEGLSNPTKVLYHNKEYYGDGYEEDKTDRGQSLLNNDYKIYEDDKNFYISYILSNKVYVSKINLSYEISDSLVKGEDGIYFKYNLYNNKLNSLNIDYIIFATSDMEKVISNIWVNKDTSYFIEDQLPDLYVGYNMINSYSADIILKYNKNLMNLEKNIRIDKNIDEEIGNELLWTGIGGDEIYNHTNNTPTNYLYETNEVESKSKKIVKKDRGKWIIQLLEIASFILYIYIKYKRYKKIKSITTEVEEDYEKRYNGKYGEPGKIRAAYVAVLTEQKASIIVMTIFLDMIRRGFIKFKKCSDISSDINFENYIIEICHSSIEEFNYEKLMIEEIERLSEYKKLSIYKFKELLELGYFSEISEECKKAYKEYISNFDNNFIKERNLEKEKWLSYKYDIINKSDKYFDSLDVRGIERVHLLSMALGNRSTEVFNRISSFKINQSRYLSMINIKNSKGITINEYLNLNNKDEYRI